MTDMQPTRSDHAAVDAYLRSRDPEATLSLTDEQLVDAALDGDLDDPEGDDPYE